MIKPATGHFDVGVTHCKVSRSLIESFAHTMLARICSETWQKDDDDGNDPIFIDQNGGSFQYILDYMRDAKASLPNSVSKEAFLLDLKYFGFNVDSRMQSRRTMHSTRLANTYVRGKSGICGLHVNVTFNILEGEAS